MQGVWRFVAWWILLCLALMSFPSKAKTALERDFPLPPAFYWKKPRIECWQNCCGCLIMVTKGIHFLKPTVAASIILWCLGDVTLPICVCALYICVCIYKFPEKFFFKLTLAIGRGRSWTASIGRSNITWDYTLGSVAAAREIMGASQAWQYAKPVAAAGHPKAPHWAQWQQLHRESTGAMPGLVVATRESRDHAGHSRRVRGVGWREGIPSASLTGPHLWMYVWVFI